MIPHSHNRVIAGVITVLLTLCYTTGKEARAQAGSGRGAQRKAAARTARSQPKEENEKARELLENGLRRDERKDWAGALEAFKQALAFSPRYGDAYIAMGDTYMNMGKYEEGFKAYQQAISVEPSNPAAHYSLGAAYNDMAQYGDSFKHFVQAIRLDPNFAEAHYGIGYAYLKLENFRDALTYLRRAAQLWPDSGETHLALGQTYLGLRDVKAAERELKILTGLDASAADSLEKEIRAARDNAELPDRDAAKPSNRTERNERTEGVPPAVEKSVASNAAPTKRAGSLARTAEQNQSSIPSPAPVLTPRAAVPSGDAGLTVELTFWESVKNSGDPEEFAAYLNKYPEGQFAELARIRMRALVRKKVETVGGNSQPRQPPPVTAVSAPDNLSKPGAQTSSYDGIAQQPKEQLSEEQPAEEQPAKEQPKEQPTAEKPQSNGMGETADSVTVWAALDSLRRLLPSNFAYQVRNSGEASAGEAAALEVRINYEPLKFEGCSIRWRDQNDELRVSLPDLDPEAVRVKPRSRPDSTFSIEVWNVSISTVGGKDAINEVKGDGSGAVNLYNGLDLQYDRREKAERLAETLRQAIRLCGGKP